MLILDGGSAVSRFRISKLRDQVRENLPSLKDLSARYLHVALTKNHLSAKKWETLERLLDYGVSVDTLTTDLEIMVFPRTGTISPWSTKATDIVHRCGLSEIVRLERGVSWSVRGVLELSAVKQHLIPLLYDRMTESIIPDRENLQTLFAGSEPGKLTKIEVLGGGQDALIEANERMGFALSGDEIDYLVEQYRSLGRDPTDAELMMFAQVNSEHCRHKIFNADWVIGGEPMPDSLFGMIRTTHERHKQGTLVAYNDNAAVIEGQAGCWFLPDPMSGEFKRIAEPLHILCKVETHNHPTGISPYPGAATGSGGEIRDEGATGRGGKPKAGITGFSVSDLRLPGASMPWELPEIRNPRQADALQIMLDGPIGGASFNNEFGRPNIGGYFRTLEVACASGIREVRRGYHKPIMLAGGLGNIRSDHVYKNTMPAGAKLVVLGGPAMLIGLGGGAASSVDSGQSTESLDFASVQRGNAEMQRRCQEVIDACIARGQNNPIITIHDVGAGGLSNALPELIHDSNLGGEFSLSKIPNDEPGMSPMQVWCNEAQERYVLAVSPDQLEEFEAICKRERCLYSVVGAATKTPVLKVKVETSPQVTHEPTVPERVSEPIDLDLNVLFGNTPRMSRVVDRRHDSYPELQLNHVSIGEAAERVLRLPGVSDKTFLVTIGDRSVTGQIVRDQMVGPWQVPVSDVAVTASGFEGYAGEAMALGERAPLALIDPASSGRMAVAEAITNIAAAAVERLTDIKVSANWMAAAGHPGEDAALYDTVRAVALELCPELGISIPVGKDSMSMKSTWALNETANTVVAPLSLVISAFAPVADIRRTLTPLLQTTLDSVLILVDLGAGLDRLGGSALAQVFGQIGCEGPDLDSPGQLAGLFAATRQLIGEHKLIAYHDRSDGGLFITLCEMAFVSRCGLEIDLGSVSDVLPALFSEEVGVVLQVRADDQAAVLARLDSYGLGGCSRVIGRVEQDHNDIQIIADGREQFRAARADLHRAWSEVSWKMQRLRDNPDCADTEYERILDITDPGLHAEVSFDLSENPAVKAILSGSRPRVAILREQGVNGQLEMAAAFDRAGFSAVDVTMSDLAAGHRDLMEFAGFAACGGFSFGDVLGAGQGWAKSILYQSRLRDMFELFLQHPGRFALGVCNGCQMLAALKELIPGAEHWPSFDKNESEQYEARQVMVEVLASDSVLLAGMEGSYLPVAVAHGEGRATFDSNVALKHLANNNQTGLRYVDNRDQPTLIYPYNPNGSTDGIAGLTAANGRVTIMMPHPERVFRTLCNSWHPAHWGEHSPWLRLFQNARAFVA